MATWRRLLGSTDGWKEMARDVKGWVIAAIFVSVVFTYWQSLESPVRVIGTSMDAKIGYIGHHYKLCRNVEYVRDSALAIDRAFIKNKANGDIVTLSLPKFTVKRDKGVYNICRIIQIPDEIEEGDWVIKTYMTYSYGIWTHTEEIPEIPVYLTYRPGEGKM